MAEKCPHACSAGVIYRVARDYGDAGPCPACWRPAAEMPAPPPAPELPPVVVALPRRDAEPDPIAGVCDMQDAGVLLTFAAVVCVVVAFALAFSGALLWLGE